MPQKKTKKKESDEGTFRDVEREMAKPRITESVRKAAVKVNEVVNEIEAKPGKQSTSR